MRRQRGTDEAEYTATEHLWWNSACRKLTGYTAPWLTSFFTRHVHPLCPDATFLDFYATVVLLRNNLTWDALEAVQGTWSPRRHVDERTLRHDVGKILRPAAMSTLALGGDGYVSPVVRGARFFHRDRRLPGITAIVDATPVPCRGSSELMNFKYHSKVVKFEVWCTLQAVPIYWRGPFLPKDHDAKIYAGLAAELDAITPRPPLPHLSEEFFAGDKGYVGHAHVITPFKKNDAEGSQLAPGYAFTTREYFDDRFVCHRNRIEHLFARLDKWRILRDNAHTMHFLGAAFDLIMSLEHVEAMEFGARYQWQPDQPVPGDHFGAVCECELKPTALLKAAAKAKRSSLVRFQLANDVAPHEGRGEKKKKKRRQRLKFGVG